MDNLQDVEGQDVARKSGKRSLLIFLVCCMVRTSFFGPFNRFWSKLKYRQWYVGFVENSLGPNVPSLSES